MEPVRQKAVLTRIMQIIGFLILAGWVPVVVVLLQTARIREHTGGDYTAGLWEVFLYTWCVSHLAFVIWPVFFVRHYRAGFLSLFGEKKNLRKGILTVLAFILLHMGIVFGVVGVILLHTS